MAVVSERFIESTCFHGSGKSICLSIRSSCIGAIVFLRARVFMDSEKSACWSIHSNNESDEEHVVFDGFRKAWCGNAILNARNEIYRNHGMNSKSNSKWIQ
jgi:hypothetical protein